MFGVSLREQWRATLFDYLRITSSMRADHACSYLAGFCQILAVCEQSMHESLYQYSLGMLLYTQIIWLSGDPVVYVQTQPELMDYGALSILEQQKCNVSW